MLRKTLQMRTARTTEPYALVNNESSLCDVMLTKNRCHAVCLWRAIDFTDLTCIQRRPVIWQYQHSARIVTLRDRQAHVSCRHASPQKSDQYQWCYRTVLVMQGLGKPFGTAGVVQSVCKAIGSHTLV